MIDARIEARWAEIEPLLDALLEQPIESRNGWLRDHCRDDELRGLVRSLLAADTARMDALEGCAASIHARFAELAGEFPEIPGYRVLSLLGEGGMASVFLAERMLGRTVQRVALKRLRLSIYDRDERRRFEHEHKILARLEHPNIARLVDAGIAPDGVPWFAMEFVEGESLVAWCDSRKVGLDARLGLFAGVCEAVQHAHQHLVVHRDLKPSNILVDRNGQAKLLDFGIAQLLDPETDRPDATGTGLRRLTPGYAAPEQYAGATSTATDVYALGVILVELLSGRKPALAGDAHRDPLNGATITREAADARACSARAIRRFLAGDIGMIVRKATRAEPALRYPTVQALMDDVAALRAGRAVAARRGDWRYRMACFARRNKAAVAASLVLVATLAAATAISLRQASEARMQATRAQAARDFVEDMLAPLRSGERDARAPTLEQVLAQGVLDLETRRRRDPVVYGDLLGMFTDTYARMGDTKTALALARRLHAHDTATFGPDDPRTLRALASRERLSRAIHGRQPGDRTAIEALLARMQGHGVTGVPLAEVLDDLAYLELNAGYSQKASDLFVRSLEQREKELGPDHPDLAPAYANIGQAEVAYSAPEVSRAWFEKAYRHAVRHIGADTRQAADFLGSIAGTETYAGRLRDAARDYDAALNIFDRPGWRTHPDRIGPLRGSCANAVQLDELRRAQADCDAALAMAARLWGTTSREYGNAARYHLLVLSAQGRLREAHAEEGRVRANFKAMPGPGLSLDLLKAYFSDVLMIEGDYARLRDDLLDALRDNFHGRWPMLVPVWTARLALACARAPDPRCPPDLASRSRAQLAEPTFRGHPRRLEMQLPLAQIAIDQGDYAGAHAYLDDIQATAALPHLRFPASHRRLAEARMLRGDAFAAQGKMEAAIGEWQAAETVFAGRYAPDHPYRLRLKGRLAQQAD